MKVLKDIGLTIFDGFMALTLWLIWPALIIGGFLLAAYLFS